MEAQIRMANPDDLVNLQVFLVAAGLSSEHVTEESIRSFLVIEGGQGELTGSLGIERFGTYGLLRSLVIQQDTAQDDLLLLFQHALQFARANEISQLFLATNRKSGVAFFNTLGFQEMTTPQLPKELLQSEPVQSLLTVDNSIFLKLILLIITNIHKVIPIK